MRYILKDGLLSLLLKSDWLSSGDSGHVQTHFNLLVRNVKQFTVLSMPDTVEEMCPEMPHLDGLMKDINDITESGARYTEMPQVIEVILPMLCNYLSYWWAKGTQNSQNDVYCCTTVTSEHLSLILGNILKILNNNLGIDNAPWMKRLAGQWIFL